MFGALYTKRANMEERRVIFVRTTAEDDIPGRRFYQPFRSVEAFQIEGESTTYCLARTLLQDHEGSDDDLPIFPRNWQEPIVES